MGLRESSSSLLNPDSAKIRRIIHKLFPSTYMIFHSVSFQEIPNIKDIITFTIIDICQLLNIE